MQPTDQNRVLELALDRPVCQSLSKLRLFRSMGRKFQLDQDCLASSVDLERCNQSAICCPDPGRRVCDLDKAYSLGLECVYHVGGGYVACLSDAVESRDQRRAFEIL